MKIKIKSLIISTSFLLVLFCFSSADGMDISYIDDIFQNSPDYSTSVMSYIQSSYNEYVCFEDDNYFYACFYPTSNFYTTFGYVSVFYIEYDYNYSDHWYVYRQNSTFDSSILTTAYNSSKLGLGAFARFDKNNNSLFIFESRCSSISNSSSENLQTYAAGDIDYSNPSSLGSPFYYYSRDNTISGFDKNILVGSWTSKSTVYFDHVFNRFASSSTVGCVNPNYVFRFQFTHSAPSAPSSVSDDRLKLSHIFGLGGIDELLINMSEFYTETGASPASGTIFSDVTLTVEYMDFQDTVTTVDIVLSSSNSTITHSSYPSTLIHLVETPYSVFGNFENYSKIEITGCSFIRTYSVITLEPQVDNFNIACSFVLKAATASSDLEPEEIDLPDYEDPEVVSQSQIEQIRQQLQEDSTAPNANTGDWSFVQDHPVVPSWADHYDFRVIYSDANSFVGNLVNANVWNYYTTNDPNGVGWITSGFIPREFLHNNSAAMFYDMIIISVYEANVSLAPDNTNILQYNNIELQGYLVFYSERYYIHRQALTQQDILSVLEYESYNDILYYTYVKEKLDDFENKTTLGLSKLIGLQGTTNSWLSSLDLRLTGTNQQLQQILTAINNIDIPEAPDLGDITNTLEYLFIPSFSWSTINYNEYLDSLGILSMPFRFGSSVFSGLENGYSPNLEYHLYEASVPLPSSLGVSGNSFKLWDDQDFTLVIASIIPDQDLLSNIRLFNLIVCIMSQAFLTYLHIFRREGGVEDGI